MDPVLLIALPLLVAVGSAALAYHLTNATMQSRMEIAVSKERELHTVARCKLEALEQSLPDKLRYAEEAARRKAFDQFMGDFHVEQRRYIRDSGPQLGSTMVTQERLYFRNIPMSNWVQHEMQLQIGTNLQQIESTSVFTARTHTDCKAMTANYLT